MVLPMVKGFIKMYLKTLLQKIEEHNSRELYVNTLKSMNSNFLLLDELAKKTTTKADDDFIDGVLEAVQESATEDGVVL